MADRARADSETPHLSRRRRPRRRWRQRLLRGFGVLAVAGALAYAALPWWAPKAAIARFVEAELSRQMSVPVHVGTLELSWRQGVRLTGLRIDGEPSFAAGEMLFVQTVRCPLSPVRMARGLPPEWLELAGVRLNAEVRADGSCNLTPLTRMTQPLPERLIVRPAVVTLQLPEQERRLRLDVSDLQYVQGQLRQFGRVSLSARLPQPAGRADAPDASAPVTLIATGSPGGSPAPAECGFRFAGVNLADLPLIALAGLPLERLEGLCTGSLQCRVNADGIIDDFVATVRVDGLDAQPSGPARLPVIDQAEISVSGAYDWYTRSLDLKRLRLKLPGVDLSGHADIHETALHGGWEGVHSLEMSGTVNPAAVATLLAGRSAALPGGLDVDGDVDVRISLLGNESQLAAGVVLDAGSASLRVGEHLAKAPGERLQLEVQGSLQRRTWQFSVDQTELRLGGNRFVGRGALQNVRRVLGGLARAEQDATPGALLEAVAALDWQGSWQIAEVDSLRRLLALDALEAVRLDGVIEGEWSIEHADAARGADGPAGAERGAVMLRSRIRLPAAARLQVGRWLEKPVGEAMAVEASCELAASPATLGRARVWATMGGSSLSIEDGEVTLSPARGLQAQGRYAVNGLHDLLAAVPAAGAWKDRLGGNLTGQFSVALGPAKQRLHVEANATPASIRLLPWLTKDAGQAGDVTLDWATDHALPPAERNRLSLRARLGPTELTADASFPPAGPRLGQAGAGQAGLNAQARLSVADVEWLLQRTPALAQALDDAAPQGSVEVDLQGSFARDGFTCRAAVNADDLGFRVPGWRPQAKLVGGVQATLQEPHLAVPRTSKQRLSVPPVPSPTKARGTPLRSQLALAVTGEAVRIERLAVDLGGSSLALAGTVKRSANARLPAEGRFWPPPGVAGADLTFRARLAADDGLKGLWPELARQAERVGASGSVQADGEIRASAEGVDLKGRYDLRRLALRVGERVRKPDDSPAGGAFAVRLPADLSAARLDGLSLETGAFRLRGAGEIPILAGGDGLIEATVQIADASALAAWAPELAGLKLSGGADLEVALRPARRAGGDEGDGVLCRTVKLRARELAGVIRDKPCRLDGEVLLTDLAMRREGATAGRVRTDSLEWALGDSRGYLVADVTDPHGSPAGRVELLCSHLDADELQRWMETDAAQLEQRGLSEEQTAKLSERAAALAAAATERLSGSDLAVSARLDRVRYFDPAVRAFYEVRQMAVEAACQRGQAEVSYRCGFNGGEVSGRYGVNLLAEGQEVNIRRQVREVLTSERLLLQLARDFPGNTVYGSFSREEEQVCPLKDLVMAGLDGRYSPKMAGSAVTVTRDGVLEGRAAPKFVTRFFPGLNLSRYRYRTMTAFARYNPDGSATNDMIYDGVNYDVYMEGVTDGGNIARYEIGVIVPRLLESPASNHRLRQGRVPAMKFRAEIADGQFKDQELTFFWPPESAYVVFVRNNMVYRLLAGGKAEAVGKAE